MNSNPEKNTANDRANDTDIENVLEILEQFGKSDTSRLKIDATASREQGSSEKQYHLGRCDIGSPWACGTPFDVLEDD